MPYPVYKDKMVYVLLIIAISAKVIYKSLTNYSGKNLLRAKGDFYYFNFLMNIVCFVLFGLLAVKEGISVYSLLLGILFGVVTAICNTYGILAFSEGPMNITDLIITSSMLVPAVSGFLFFQESFHALKLVFTLFLIFFIQLAVNKGRQNESKVNRKWILYCLIAFVSQGAIGVMQKIHQSSSHRQELSGFLAVAFLTSLVYSGFMSKKEKRETAFKAKDNIFALISGLCVFLMNYLNLKLSGMLPSQIFFPFSAGSGIILVLIVSITFFKEKLNARQITGLIGGIVSLIGICIF